MPRHLLFDLDGTLLAPEAGIIASIQRGLEAVGVGAPPASDLNFVIGPPLRQSFPMLGVAPERIDIALDAYRRHYTSGAMFDAAIYEGIPEALETLAARGHVLHVATSKPHVFAKPILEHFALARYFASIHGAELDGSRDAKADVIGYLLGQQRVDTADALMIGDTAFDVIGARHHGIATIGVAWGHGGRHALETAGAALVVGHPRDVPEAIASGRWRP